MDTPRPLPPALRLDRVAWPVRGLGPGRRVGLWVQGCTLGCPGCVSPSLWPERGGSEVPVRALAESIAATPACDGLTVSGGEPFEQYGALMALAAYLKALRSSGGGAPIEIGVYTGYRLEELVARHPDGAFLRLLDWIIDGRYLRDRPADDGVRGSDNQRHFRFEGGVAVERPPWPGAAHVDLAVPDGQVAVMALVPRAGELSRLVEDLGRAGMPARWR